MEANASRPSLFAVVLLLELAASRISVFSDLTVIVTVHTNQTSDAKKRQAGRIAGQESRPQRLK